MLPDYYSQITGILEKDAVYLGLEKRVSKWCAVQLRKMNHPWK